MRLFQSFFLGGFECSTHRLRNGRRLDLVHATRHDEFAASDFRLLQRHGIFSVREGLRWHLIESQPNRFDFSTAQSIIDAACETGTQVIWDLWHYGWPDDIDIFTPEFVTRFTKFATAAAEQLSEKIDAPLICPINEISFFSWAGGDGGIFNPFARDRGNELKRQLVRATVESIKAMRQTNPRITFFHIDPMINVLATNPTPENVAAAGASGTEKGHCSRQSRPRSRPLVDERDDVVGVG